MSDAQYHREWRRRNKARCDEAQRRYKEKVGAHVIALHSNHGLTMDEAREALAARPAGCEICGREMKLYYDHNHSSGEHRGWLCNRCNLALNLVEDADLLASALSYLERSYAAV